MNLNGCPYYCLCKSIVWRQGNITLSAQRTQRRKHLGDSDFFVGAEDGAYGFADFAESGVGFYGVVDEGH